VVEQQADVLAPLAQRRESDLEARQAMQQRRLELALADLVLEVGIGGRDQSHLDRGWLVGADRQDLAGLEDAQQRDLNLGRRFADLVEKQRAAVRGAEQAVAVARRSGVGAAGRAEQLGGGDAISRG
jgi:hypothetical protein